MKPVREVEYFLAWVVFMVTGAIGGFVAGAIGGGIVGAILSASGTDIGDPKFMLGCKIGGFVAGLPISYMLFRLVTGSMLVKKAATRCSSEDPANNSVQPAA